MTKEKADSKKQFRLLKQFRVSADGKAIIKDRFIKSKHRGQCAGAFGKQGN